MTDTQNCGFPGYAKEKARSGETSGSREAQIRVRQRRRYRGRHLGTQVQHNFS